MQDMYRDVCFAFLWGGLIIHSTYISQEAYIVYFAHYINVLYLAEQAEHISI